MAAAPERPRRRAWLKHAAKIQGNEKKDTFSRYARRGTVFQEAIRKGLKRPRLEERTWLSYKDIQQTQVHPAKILKSVMFRVYSQ